VRLRPEEPDASGGRSTGGSCRLRVRAALCCLLANWCGRGSYFSGRQTPPPSPTRPAPPSPTSLGPWPNQPQASWSPRAAPVRENFHEIGRIDTENVLPAGVLHVAMHTIRTLTDEERTASLVVNFGAPNERSEQSYIAQTIVICKTNMLSVNAWSTFSQKNGKALRSVRIRHRQPCQSRILATPWWRRRGQFAWM
jgi:hypothetical protein